MIKSKIRGHMIAHRTPLSPLESNSESLDAIQPKLCRFKVYLPHPHTKGTADLRDGWGYPTMFGMDVLT